MINAFFALKGAAFNSYLISFISVYGRVWLGGGGGRGMWNEVRGSFTLAQIRRQTRFEGG